MEEASELARTTEQIANQDVGERETDGPNDSPRIREYQGYTGAKPNSPYCASANSLWVHEAGVKLGVKPKLKKSARALGLWERNLDLQIKPEDFTAACLPCIVILDHDGTKGHAYLAIGYDEVTGKIQSIDPNSNPAGSREGGGVYLLNIRSIHDKQLKGMLRIE